MGKVGEERSWGLGMGRVKGGGLGGGGHGLIGTCDPTEYVK